MLAEDLLQIVPSDRGLAFVAASCESGLGTEISSDEEKYAGIAAGLILGGATTVVGSLWPVEDRVTEKLVKHLYKSFAHGKTFDDALREARRQAKSTGGSTMGPAVGTLFGVQEGTLGFGLDHPYFWAGFQCVGEPDVRFGHTLSTTT